MGGPGPGPGPAAGTDALRPCRGQVAAAPRPAPGQRPRAGSWPCPGPGAVLPRGGEGGSWSRAFASGAASTRGRSAEPRRPPLGPLQERASVARSLTATGGSAEQVGAVLSTCVSSHGSSFFVQVCKYRGVSSRLSDYIDGCRP